MEIVEAIFALGAGMLEAGDACLCFVQIVALFADGTSVFTGYQAVRKGRQRKEQIAEGVTPQRNVYKVVFWVLLPLAASMTVWVILSLVRAWGK